MSCHISVYSGTSKRFFINIKCSILWWARKRIHYSNEGRIEKSVPQDHPLSSLGKPRDGKRRSSGRIFLSHLDSYSLDLQLLHLMLFLRLPTWCNSFCSKWSYSQTCFKRPLKTDKSKVLMENDSLMKVKMYCRMLPLEHSAILLTCIKQ